MPTRRAADCAGGDGRPGEDAERRRAEQAPEHESCSTENLRVGGGRWFAGGCRANRPILRGLVRFGAGQATWLVPGRGHHSCGTAPGSHRLRCVCADRGICARRGVYNVVVVKGCPAPARTGHGAGDRRLTGAAAVEGRRSSRQGRRSPLRAMAETSGRLSTWRRRDGCRSSERRPMTAARPGSRRPPSEPPRRDRRRRAGGRLHLGPVGLRVRAPRRGRLRAARVRRRLLDLPHRHPGRAAGGRTRSCRS